MVISFPQPPPTQKIQKNINTQLSMNPRKPGETAVPTAAAPPQATGVSVSHVPFQVQSQPPVLWSTGLCDCKEDVGNCCITCWCPCITFGQIAEIVDKGSLPCGASGAIYFLIAVFTGCACIYSCMYRRKLRSQYSLLEAPCNDCLVHCCCEACALCQEYRELNNRGFEMIIGWNANMERRQGQGMAQPMQPPPMQEAMNR